MIDWLVPVQVETYLGRISNRTVRIRCTDGITATHLADLKVRYLNREGKRVKAYNVQKTTAGHAFDPANNTCTYGCCHSLKECAE